jgi:outer membrane lipoprotein LolB
MTLTGQPGHVMLETASGKKFVANSLEQLFVQQTGLNLPVSDLYFWIRGLPVPNLPMQKQFDPYGRLSLLTQQDWQIQFLRYTHANQLDLPNKIFIKNQHINLKLVITTW